MNFDFSEEQNMLREHTRRLLEDSAPPDRLRELITQSQPWDEPLWQSMAGLGLLGAAIPEAYGGTGLGETDLCVIAEEVGRAVSPVPFFSSICLAAEAVKLAGTEAQKSKWLPRLASGESVGSFGICEGPGSTQAASFALEFSNGKLNGFKSPVPDASLAEFCIVVAQRDNTQCLVLVELDQPGVGLTALDGLDQLRQHARIDFTQADGELMDGAETSSALRALEHRAAVYCAFEQIGGAEACLYMARDYAMERHIFARPVASYQAIKHKLADIFVAIEIARSNAFFAAWALEASPGEQACASATARLSGITAYEMASRENLQVHGGIGYTWEANCHFHYKRARLLALNLGGTELWNARLIETMAEDLNRNSDKAA